MFLKSMSPILLRSACRNLISISMQAFWDVYGRELGFLESVNERDIFVRTSVETRTMQVAGGFIAGMDPAFVSKAFPVTTQPSPVSDT